MEERFEYHGFEGIKLDFEETYGHIVFPKEKAYGIWKEIIEKIAFNGEVKVWVVLVSKYDL